MVIINCVRRYWLILATLIVAALPAAASYSRSALSRRADFANLQVCFGRTDPGCLDVHDFDVNGNANGVIDFPDVGGFAQCFNGPDFAPLPGCELAPAKLRGTVPETGMFTLHGRPIDVLPDGKVLMDFRTRIYDPQHGRWLQRDAADYADGANLYEAFRTNAQRFRDPDGKEVWGEVRERRVNLNGQELVAVEYWIAENGASLGLGGQLALAWNWMFGEVPNSEIVERKYVGTEYFAYSSDPRIEGRRIISVENMRQIVEEGYIANRDVANLRQGIIVLGTTAVALPVSAAAAPAVTSVTGTSFAGLTASGMITGGVSLGAGSAVGHTLVGDSASEVAAATLRGTAQGVVFGGVFGAASRFDMSLTGPNAFKLTYGPLWEPAVAPAGPVPPSAAAIQGASTEATTIDRIRAVAQQSYNYAVQNPRAAGLSRMQLGKDAEVQATGWLRRWAERSNVDFGRGGLQFQVRGANSVPGVVFDPTRHIFDFKLTPRAIRPAQTQNFQRDFPGYNIEYIFGP